MILSAFSLYDTKALIFSPPFYVHTRGMAVRMVMDLLNDMNTTIARHPNDFQLYEVGTFDDQTGSLLSIPPVNLGVAASFAPQAPEAAQAPLFGRDR